MQEHTHNTEKRGDHGPAVLHPGPRPVADHVFNTIVEVIAACKSQRQTDGDPASQTRRPPREPHGRGSRAVGSGWGEEEGVSPGPHPGLCTCPHHIDPAHIYLKGSEIHGSLGSPYFFSNLRQSPKSWCGHPKDSRRSEWTIPGLQGWFTKDRPLQGQTLCLSRHRITP